MDQPIDQPMASAKSASSSDDEIMVSIPWVSRDHHHHGHHHHHRYHKHSHRHRGPHGERFGECSHGASVLHEPRKSFVLGDVICPRDYNHHRHQCRSLDHHMCGYNRHGERKFSKFMRRKKNSELHRGRHARHFKHGMFRRALRRRCDQRGLSDSGARAVDHRNGFPSHLVENWQDVDGLEAKAVGSTYSQYVERGISEVGERGWSCWVGVEEAVAETLALSSQLQTVFPRKGHRGKHGHKHHHRCHRKHHRQCPHPRPQMSGAPVELVVEPRYPSTRVDIGQETPAAVPVTQPRDEAGPSATYEEKLAEGLIPGPEDSS